MVLLSFRTLEEDFNMLITDRSVTEVTLQVGRDVECLEVFRAIDPFACECIIGKGQSKDMQDRTKGNMIISFVKYKLGTV